MATKARIYALSTCALCTYAFCILSSSLYICHFPSTFVERTLQINSFMQNKANFPDDQMNVTVFYTKEYENETLSRSGKNKANTKPNKPNLLDDQMNVSAIITKEYENLPLRRCGENKPNTKPIQTQSNPISRSYLKTRLYGLHVANESGNIVVQGHCEEVCAFRRKLFHR